MKKSYLKPRSKKGQDRMDRLAKLVKFLIEFRAHGYCEICHDRPDFRGLGGAHIEPRDYTSANDTIDNIIVSCAKCHNHDLYPSHEHGGLKITKTEALHLVKIKNERYNIASRWEHLNE